jgi:predicted N-acetyltransferase YhbS
MKERSYRKGWIVAFILLLPLIVFADFQGVSLITELIRQQSDIAVLLGVLGISALGAVNYFLAVFIKSRVVVKTKTKKQKSK